MRNLFITLHMFCYIFDSSSILLVMFLLKSLARICWVSEAVYLFFKETIYLLCSKDILLISFFINTVLG